MNSRFNGYPLNKDSVAYSLFLPFLNYAPSDGLR